MNPPPTVFPQDDQRTRLVALAAEIRELPYAWPAEPTADAVRRTGSGSCASKHALLAEELDALGLQALPLLVVGRLVPEVLCGTEPFAGAADLIEVHECLTVLTPWAGPVRVDITFDDGLIAHGLPGTTSWDGASDMPLATGDHGPGWSVPPTDLRAQKELLRTRIYQSDPTARERRDHMLELLSQRYASWRAGA